MLTSSIFFLQESRFIYLYLSLALKLAVYMRRVLIFRNLQNYPLVRHEGVGGCAETVPLILNMSSSYR